MVTKNNIGERYVAEYLQANKGRKGEKGHTEVRLPYRTAL